MGSRRHDVQPGSSAPRIYLIVPCAEDVVAPMDELAAALDAADIAAVLVASADMNEQALIDRIMMLAPVVQTRGVALLVQAAADVAARSGADGVHVASIDALRPALDGLKPHRIVGAGGLETRHDAMLAAEAGADYVMFGEPDRDGRRSAFVQIVERVTWWAELFEVPCVAFAAALDEVGPLAGAGADFVAVGDFLWAERGGAATAIRQVAERLHAHRMVREPAP